MIGEEEQYFLRVLTSKRGAKVSLLKRENPKPSVSLSICPSSPAGVLRFTVETIHLTQMTGNLYIFFFRLFFYIWPSIFF